MLSLLLVFLSQMYLMTLTLRVIIQSFIHIRKYMILQQQRSRSLLNHLLKVMQSRLRINLNSKGLLITYQMTLSLQLSRQRIRNTNSISQIIRIRLKLEDQQVFQFTIQRINLELRSMIMSITQRYLVGLSEIELRSGTLVQEEQNVSMNLDLILSISRLHVP